MNKFINENFLLENEMAKKLFFTYAKDKPIIDYHCHLSEKEIYEDKPFNDLGELWLKDDHYKWRLVRANGSDEKFVTGAASYHDKFIAFCQAMDYAVGNPVYHWSHLELKRYFDIDDIICLQNAEKIWTCANKIIKEKRMSPRMLIENSKVCVLCTTNNPWDSMEYHKRLAEDQTFKTKVIPAYRPDGIMEIEKTVWKNNVAELGKSVGIKITNLSLMQKALMLSMEKFEKYGCVSSDHAFEYLTSETATFEEAEQIFSNAVIGNPLSVREIDRYKMYMIQWLGKQYYKFNWVMQLHIGSIRNANSRGVSEVGEACGFDTVGDKELARPLTNLFDTLERSKQLPKSIIYNLNNKDNAVMTALAYTFQDSMCPAKIQFGSAWWFRDNMYEMEKQMTDLAQQGLLGRFVGMLTDSRCYLSYSRHEYFRRIMCNTLGKWAEKGYVPNDEAMLGKTVEAISFDNVKSYFNLKEQI